MLVRIRTGKLINFAHFSRKPSRCASTPGNGNLASASTDGTTAGLAELPRGGIEKLYCVLQEAFPDFP